MLLLIYEYTDSLTTLLIYKYTDSLMTFLIYQYVDVLTIPQAYENVLLYVYCHSVHFLEYLPDCKNYFDFFEIRRASKREKNGENESFSELSFFKSF